MPEEERWKQSRKFVVILKGLLMIEKNKVPTKFSFLIHRAPTTNRRKLMILIGVETKQSKKIQNQNNEVKTL